MTVTESIFLPQTGGKEISFTLEEASKRVLAQAIYRAKEILSRVGKGLRREETKKSLKKEGVGFRKRASLSQKQRGGGGKDIWGQRSKPAGSP